MNRSQQELLAAAAADDGACLVPAAAGGRLGFLLAALGLRIEEIATAQFVDIGLEGFDYMTMAVLAVDAPGTQHELANLMGKAPGVIVAEIDRLEAKGLVERQRDPADRRRSVVRLTAGGEALLARADEIAGQLVAGALAGLDDDGRAQLLELLQRGLGIDPATCASASSAGTSADSARA